VECCVVGRCRDELPGGVDCRDRQSCGPCLDRKLKTYRTQCKTDPGGVVSSCLGLFTKVFDLKLARVCTL
jgi:hypothetical protein